MTDLTVTAQKRPRLAGVPAVLAEAIREAIVAEDIDDLYELADGVAEHDAEVAAFVRRLIEDYAYDALGDLFDVRGR